MILRNRGRVSKEVSLFYRSLLSSSFRGFCFLRGASISLTLSCRVGKVSEGPHFQLGLPIVRVLSANESKSRLRLRKCPGSPLCKFLGKRRFLVVWDSLAHIRLRLIFVLLNCEPCMTEVFCLSGSFHVGLYQAACRSSGWSRWLLWLLLGLESRQRRLSSFQWVLKTCNVYILACEEGLGLVFSGCVHPHVGLVSLLLKGLEKLVDAFGSSFVLLMSLSDPAQKPALIPEGHRLRGFLSRASRCEESLQTLTFLL